MFTLEAGQTGEAKKQYDLVEYIGRLNSFNRIVYNRELSAFYADHDIHPKEALELARKEFEVRHDIYTWDNLAWALYRNNRQQEAAAAMKEALSLDTKDALLLFSRRHDIRASRRQRKGAWIICNGRSR